MRALRRFPLLLLLLGGAACSADRTTAAAHGPFFHLTVDGSRYAAGEVVSGLLHNDGASVLPYSLCSGALEQRQGSGAWAVVDGWAFPCAVTIPSLPAGDSVRWQYSLKASRTPGTYRVRFYQLPDTGVYAGPDAWRSSPSFVVTAAASAGLQGPPR
jgi:hypothetical protein